MSPTASPHFVELDPMHGGCPNEWNNYEDYEAEDLVAVVVSGGCEAPTTPKPTKSPLKLTPKPTNQFCFDTPAPSASPITLAPSKSPITPQPSASPSKNVRYYMFSLCLVNDRGGLIHIYSHVFSSRSYLSAFKESICVSHYTGSFKVSYNTSAKCFSVQECKILLFSLCLELIELVLLIHIPISSPHVHICQPSSSPSESPTVCIVLYETFLICSSHISHVTLPFPFSTTEKSDRFADNGKYHS